jgi:hypothetical protein
MSKGPKPPPNNPPIRPQDPEIVVDVAPEECWTFQLVDTTVAAQHVKNGASVTGSAQDRKRVLVSARGEALGFAPATESRGIIAAAAKSGGTLRGQVLSAADGVVVELCLTG